MRGKCRPQNGAAFFGRVTDIYLWMEVGDGDVAQTVPDIDLSIFRHIIRAKLHLQEVSFGNSYQK